MEHIIAQLDELSEVRAAAEITRRDYEARRAEILKAVQAELDELEAEYQPLLDAAQKRAETLEAEIRQAVEERGASVRGAHLQAVYTRGRVTWDSRKLDRYAESHPDINAFRRQGEPSVALRVAK